jgi:hypothetical protein
MMTDMSTQDRKGDNAMEKKKIAKVRDWLEPAHPMVLKFRDDLILIYRHIREHLQSDLDDAFDKVASEIGYLVTTTLPLRIEVAKASNIKTVELGAEHLRGTIFEKRFLPILKKMGGMDGDKNFNVTEGVYNVYLIWLDALKLRFRTDWVEPAHFHDYLQLQDRFRDVLRFDWVEPAHVALGGMMPSPVDPDVMEPAHLKPALQPWREKVLLAVIDEVYPELRLIDRISKLKDILRHRVPPDVIEPAHFREFAQRLPAELLAEFEALLRKHGY